MGGMNGMGMGMGAPPCQQSPYGGYPPLPPYGYPPSPYGGSPYGGYPPPSPYGIPPPPGCPPPMPPPPYYSQTESKKDDLVVKADDQTSLAQTMDEAKHLYEESLF